MKLIKGIEGDYLETKDDNLFFDVKGLLHPNDQKICFIRFYPDPKGDRMKDGIYYKKIYELKDRYAFLKQNHPKYLFYSEQLGLELQGVKNKDIKKIYTPREYFRELIEKSDLNRMEKCSRELCELLISEGDLPENSIGVTGSQMIGLNKGASDIDLIIYGTEVSLKFQDKLASLLKSGHYCRKYSTMEYQNHYEWRVGGSNIPFDTFLHCETRKHHQGMYKGFEFFIRYIKSPEHWGGSYNEYKYEDFGRIKLKAEILDSTDSIFTPCSYKINVMDIIDGDGARIDIEKEDILEVNSFRGRFCEHAIKNEVVLIEGKIENVKYKGKKEYYRILLNDQVLDKMIIQKKGI